jgi:hypothetical protein
VLEGRFEGIDSLRADAGDGPIGDGSSACGRACVRACVYVLVARSLEATSEL